MARQYDRQDLLDRAVALFRRQGFSGTSTAALVTALGVNRKTMYAEFGSKQALFEAALERYAAHHLSRVLAPVEAPDAGLDAIRSAFAAWAAASEGPSRGIGCLLCNTAVERGALDSGSGRHVAAYFERLTRAFRRALGNAQARGDVDTGVDLDEQAAFLTTVLIGVAAGVRAEAPAGHLWATSNVVSKVLDSLAPASRSR